VARQRASGGLAWRPRGCNPTRCPRGSEPAARRLRGHLPDPEARRLGCAGATGDGTGSVEAARRHRGGGVGPRTGGNAVRGAGCDLDPALRRPVSSDGGATMGLRSDGGSATLAARRCGCLEAVRRSWPRLEEARRRHCTREGFYGCGSEMPG
jgi:hypothetical protein